MEQEIKSRAVIEWKEYTLDSDNVWLLEMLKDARYNKDTKKMEWVPYLPIATVYSLLEQFYPNYSFESKPLEIEKTYTVKKEKRNNATKQRENMEEEVILFKKSVKLTIWNRSIEWEARWVASIGMITLDQIYNGFSMKQEARAIKNACKKLGKIFRIPNDREEVMEKDSIKSDLTITDVVKNISTWNPTPQPVQAEPTATQVAEQSNDFEDMLVKDYKDMIEEWMKDNKDIKIVNLQQIGIKIREKHGFDKQSKENETLMKVFNVMKDLFSL